MMLVLRANHTDKSDEKKSDCFLLDYHVAAS